jgi:hypothetical protein
MRRDDELTPEEQAAFAALQREAAAGDLLEERTVRALAARGLLRRRGSTVRRIAVWAGAAAACALFFAAGFALGQGRAGRRTGAAPAGLDASRPASEGAPRADLTLAATDSTAAGSAAPRYVVWF